MGSTITIDFHGDPLAAILDDRGTFVPLKPLVTGMGLNWSGQFARVKRDAILGEAICMMQMGVDPATVCLPLDLVPGFLFTIDASRVAEAVRPKVLDYQRECFRVLADACLGKPVQHERVSAEILPPAPITTPDPRICIRMVTEARHVFGVQPARELWFALGLPRVPAMMAAPRQGDLFTYRREM